MKKLIASISGVALLWAMSASATDITINDGVFNNNNWYGNYENDEVEPGCYTGQKWDMEAFLLDDMDLQVKGGVDMVKGVYSIENNRRYYSGDIFIDVNNNAKWGPNAPKDITGDGYDQISNTELGWDYAIVFNRETADVGGSKLVDNTYSVYQLASTFTYIEVYYDENFEANPFRYIAGGSPVANVTDTKYEWTDGPLEYLMKGIDLSFLAGVGDAGEDDITFHYTYGCGNDLLIGKTKAFAPVPDGGLTLVLLGMGLGALGVTSRRMRKS